MSTLKTAHATPAQHNAPPAQLQQSVHHATPTMHYTNNLVSPHVPILHISSLEPAYHVLVA